MNGMAMCPHCGEWYATSDFELGLYDIDLNESSLQTFHTECVKCKGKIKVVIDYKPPTISIWPDYK